ncbi:oligosaccharide flippase family protein [Shewanella marisflavi]|uniref:oligosaccharide flippase family protein n=1 Tax=Shewanella marisflavi TaxID=260364 RepID=UPI00200BC3C6|nr:oligosaccharide flippase family protein [Shewanella marisflavi]MCL1040919.1 oligosaccharide flippase family protein [Shewanella marisflavi]
MKISDVVYLFIQYFCKLGVPLATIPILSRTLSVEQFSINLTFQSIVLWLSIIVEFGFIYTATRDIAQSNRVENVISKVLSAQVLLFILSSILMLFCVFLMESVQGLWLEACFALLTLFFFSITPNYVFHGLSDFKRITQFDIVGAIIFLILVIAIYYFKLDRAYYALGAFAIGRMFTFLLSFYSIRRYLNFKEISIANGISQIKSGLSAFLFKAGASLYGSAAVIIMGASLPVKQVALYLAAERMVRAYQGLLGPLSQVLYPMVVKSKNATDKSFSTALVIQLLIGFIGVVTFYYLIDKVILLFYGEAFSHSAKIAMLLIWIVPIIACSNMYGINGLLARGFDRVFTNIILFCGIVSIPMSIVFVNYKGAFGMALSIVLTELVILLLLRVSYSKCIK